MSSVSMEFTTAKPEFSIEDARIAITGSSLISFMVGDFLVIMNSTPDVIISDEPYLCLMVLVEMKSGIFIRRIWNRTVARGKVMTIQELEDLCKKHFFQGKPCLGYPCYVNETEEHGFLISQTPIPRKISRYCLELPSSDAEDDESSCSQCLRLNESEDHNLIDVGTKCEVVIKSESEEYCDTNVAEGTSNTASTPNTAITSNSFAQKDMKTEGIHKGCSERRKFMKLSCSKLIENAINKSDQKMLSFEDICASINEEYPQFKMNDTVWQNAVRGHLSMLDKFSKVAGKNEEACLWQINYIHKDMAESTTTIIEHQEVKDEDRASETNTQARKASLTPKSGEINDEKWLPSGNQQELKISVECEQNVRLLGQPILPSGGRPKAGAKGKLTYQKLITEAINTSNKKMLTLSGIYAYISSEHPHFSIEEKRWQNAIRHNLSLNTKFEKIPRRMGRGCVWVIKGGRHDVRDAENFENSVVSESEEGIIEAGNSLDNEINRITTYTNDFLDVDLPSSLGVAKKFKCILCEKEFGVKISLVRHAKDIHGLGEFNCKECEFKALYVDKIVEHVQHEHDQIVNQEISCPSCNSNVEVLEITEHYKECLKVKDRVPVKCKLCERVVAKNSIYEHEKAYHGRGKFVCPCCDFKAPFSHEIVKHMEMEEHGDDFDIHCPSCKMPIPVKDIVAHYKLCPRQQHYRLKRLKKIVCKTCGKVCEGNSTYKNHIKIHMRAEGVKESETNIKLYHYCDKCERRFLQKGQLVAHIRSVHDKIDFTCPECPMTFKTQHEVYRHNRLEHSTDKRFDCKYCGKRFSSMSSARSHELVHENPQFQCRFCSKLIKTEKNLIAHERIHTGEKPFPCKVCSAAFTNLNRLRQHEQGVHKIIGPKGGTGWLKQKKKDLS